MASESVEERRRVSFLMSRRRERSSTCMRDLMSDSCCSPERGCRREPEAEAIVDAVRVRRLSVGMRIGDSWKPGLMNMGCR